MAMVSPTLSKPDIGKGRIQAVQFMRTKASGHPSWPGVIDSTEGRIHWRRPTAILRFSLATLREYDPGIRLGPVDYRPTHGIGD